MSRNGIFRIPDVRRMRAGGLVLLLCLTPAVRAFTDCRLPLRASDVAICDSPALVSRDATLEALYRSLRGGLLPVSQDELRMLRAQQLREIAACGGDMRCLLSRYDRSVAALRHRYDRAARAVARQGERNSNDNPDREE